MKSTRVSGGGSAQKSGATLRNAATHHQVFAISHLPQIAAAAHHHIVVSKGARGGVTTADVHVVDGEARVQEIARMLGGDPEREVSLAHARELLGGRAPSAPEKGEPQKGERRRQPAPSARRL